MGQHLRSAWRAFNEVRSGVRIVDVYGPFGDPDLQLSQEIKPALTQRTGEGINVYCVNGDEVERIQEVLGEPLARGAGYNIVYPAWELERYPDEWAKQLDRFDEVWAQSAFTHAALSKAVSKPVIHQPLPCAPRRRALLSRRYFGIRESAYAFYFSFDFLSFVERKNPFAIVEAFRALLEARPYADVVLVIKTNNSIRKPDMKASFDAAVAPLQDRVRVIDTTLSEAVVQALMGLTDCFVSLHRSEGFGFGIAEAMSLAKPVIATAYAGNMDFCTYDTAFLVPYQMIALRQGDYPHWKGQHWANADVEAATRAMVRLVDNPQEGRMIGARARMHLATNFGYLAAGLRYAARIDDIAAKADPSDLVGTVAPDQTATGI